jgi:hypothetical protein
MNIVVVGMIKILKYFSYKHTFLECEIIMYSNKGPKKNITILSNISNYCELNKATKCLTEAKKSYNPDREIKVQPFCLEIISSFEHHLPL